MHHIWRGRGQFRVLGRVCAEIAGVVFTLEKVSQMLTLCSSKAPMVYFWHKNGSFIAPDPGNQGLTVYYGYPFPNKDVVAFPRVSVRVARPRETEVHQVEVSNIMLRTPAGLSDDCWQSSCTYLRSACQCAAVHVL